MMGVTERERAGKYICRAISPPPPQENKLDYKGNASGKFRHSPPFSPFFSFLLSVQTCSGVDGTPHLTAAMVSARAQPSLPIHSSADARIMHGRTHTHTHTHTHTQKKVCQSQLRPAQQSEALGVSHRYHIMHINDISLFGASYFMAMTQGKVGK